jgi:hypothetical protein
MGLLSFRKIFKELRVSARETGNRDAHIVLTQTLSPYSFAENESFTQEPCTLLSCTKGSNMIMVSVSLPWMRAKPKRAPCVLQRSDRSGSKFVITSEKKEKL